MKTFLRVVFALVFTAFLVAPTLATARADTPADVLDSYIVSIVPQTDGTLHMSFVLAHYCTNSDWPNDQPYLQIAAPNSNFVINDDWGPKDGKNKVVSTEIAGGYFAQLNFDPNNLPKNGDCFDLHFSINQSKMAYPDPQNGNTTFAYYPGGWTFPIQVKHLTISWALPTDSSLIKVVDPAPQGKDDQYMLWGWDNPQMDASHTFSSVEVKLAYDKSAFTLSDAATTQSSSPNGGQPDQLMMLCLTVIVIIVIVVLILWLLAAVAESIDSGDGLGTAFVTVANSAADAISEAGGEGGSSGNSSGCACAGCACACACAGGGKVGCMLKLLGIKIGCLKKVIAEMVGEDTKKKE